MRQIAFIIILAFISQKSAAQCDTTGVLLELQATTNLQGLLLANNRCLTAATVLAPLIISGDTLSIDTTGLGGGGSSEANNGVSDNEDGGKIRLGNRYMGTPDAPFTMNRKINMDGRFLYIGDLSDSTILVADGSSDRVGVGTDLPARKLDVNGEVRIRDLSTDTPTLIVGADADGDLASLGVGSNLVITGGNLAVTGLSYQGLRDDGFDFTKRLNENFVTTATVAASLTDDLANDETEIRMDVVDNSISNAKIRQGVARSVVGVTGNTTANVADIQGTADQVLRVNGAGNALAFGTVATAGIADDAVTYAKIQNVVNDERLLGRVSGANGNVEELTVAQVYTMLGLTGTANRFALWTGANALGSDDGFTFTLAPDRATFTGSAAGTGANNAILNLNSGSLSASTEFLRMSGTIQGDMLAVLNNARNTAATDHSIFHIISGGTAGGDAFTRYSVGTTISHSIGVDNTDDRLKLTPNSATPGGNANMGVIIYDNAGTGNVGINKDWPNHPLDGLGIARFELWQGTGNKFTSANIAFGNGAGTGAGLTSIVGLGNGVRITWTSGTGPTADGDVMTVSYPFLFTTTSIVTISPRSKQAAIDIDKFFVSAEDNAGFTIKANGTITNPGSYAFDIHFWGY